MFMAFLYTLCTSTCMIFCSNSLDFDLETQLLSILRNVHFRHLSVFYRFLQFFAFIDHRNHSAANVRKATHDIWLLSFMYPKLKPVCYRFRNHVIGDISFSRSSTFAQNAIVAVDFKQNPHLRTRNKHSVHV
jgi:hypothetical protein